MQLFVQWLNGGVHSDVLFEDFVLRGLIKMVHWLISGLLIYVFYNLGFWAFED